MLGQFHFVKLALVDFVYNNKYLFAKAKCLFQNVSCLWHTTFDGINKQQYAVHHGQNALYFATEIGVAGGVDDVDFLSVVVHSGVFCKDGDSAFAFDVVAVHNAVGNNFVSAENSVLLQQLIHKRCFAVVNVGNDCNVTYIFSYHSISICW